MAEYVVKLADERGRIQEQVQIAGSAEELRSRFSQAGYYVYSVRPRGMRGVGGSRKKANLEAFIIFNQQFLTLVRAGLPGESLSAAFEAQGGFPLIYTTTLLAGERSGQLEDVLSRYLAFQRISLSFRKKLMASLLYPCLLITMVSALFVFLISFVVPRFALLYDQLGTNLPAATRMLLSVGNNFQHYILWMLAGIALIVYGLFRYSQTTAGAARIDRMRIGMPVFGNIWRKYQVALFVRTLSSLLTGGLPPVPSLETAARSISSNTIAQAVMASVGTVREGKSLAQSLEKTGVFPDLAVEMIDVGESTGALPQMLNSVAEFFEEDVQTALTASLALIEPAILIVMGSVVVVILIALYLPIFSLGQASTLGGH
jgi:type IV pilus assembly protein PilC